jgi:hypothetical protein
LLELVVQVSRVLAFEVAPQDDSLAAEEPRESDRVIDAKQVAELKLYLLHICAGKNFAAEREVKFIHLAPDIPCVFLWFLARNVRGFKVHYQYREC